jgi:hypothetical protein
MSDYKHEKVIRLPFPKDILNKCSTDNPWDCEDYLRERLGELWGSISRSSFKIECTDRAFYIDWLYYTTYGEESSEWSRARFLTKEELEVITPYFNKLGVDYEEQDLRVADYCYYNCCGTIDCYDIFEEDDSSILI